MLLFKGENGQGKSNLLEAIYLLAIAKSARASTDRELVRKQSISADTYSRVAAEVDRNGDSQTPRRLRRPAKKTALPTRTRSPFRSIFA